jgi:DNA-binding transcriptional MerR regulator
MDNKHYSTGEVAQQLGLVKWKFLYLLDKGLVPGPTLSLPGRRVFTSEDIERIRQALEARQAAKEEGGKRG